MTLYGCQAGDGRSAVLPTARLYVAETGNARASHRHISPPPALRNTWVEFTVCTMSHRPSLMPDSSHWWRLCHWKLLLDDNMTSTPAQVYNRSLCPKWKISIGLLPQRSPGANAVWWSQGQVLWNFSSFRNEYLNKEQLNGITVSTLLNTAASEHCTDR